MYTMMASKKTDASEARMSNKVDPLKRNNNSESNGGLFDTLEKMVLTAEARSDLPSTAIGRSRSGTEKGFGTTFGGPLSTQELSHLSLICAGSYMSRDDSTKQGFGSVDGDLLMNLVPLLDQHVAAAASVDLIREASKVVANMKASKIRESRDDKQVTMDMWLNGAFNLASANGVGYGTVRMMTVKNGLEAATILLAIMMSPGVDPRVVSEDSIEGCIVLLRQHLSKNVTPSLTNTGHLHSRSCASDNVTPTPKKRRRESGAAKELDLQKELRKIYKHCIATIPLLLSVFERFENLVAAVSLDDQPILTLCSTALIVFTIEPSSSLNDEGSYCHLLQISSIGLVTAIFHKYPRHRHVIVEDLFPIMLNLPTTKKWMRSFPLPLVAGEAAHGPKSQASRRLSFADEQNSVQSFTVLILSLIQTCVVMPRFETSEEFQEATAAMVAQGQQPRSSPELKSGLVNCHAMSDLIVGNLLQRCGKKGEEGGASEFRPVLQNLVDDLLKLQLSPEYPASEMLLLSLSRIIGSQIQKASSTGPKGSTNSSSIGPTYLTTGFDVLGKICASLATVLVRHRENPLSISRQIEQNQEARDNGKEVNSCRCGRTHSNNTFMVCCDKCHGWSHGECVGVTHATLGSEWLCDDCKLKQMAIAETEKFTLRRSIRGDITSSDGSDIPEIMEIHVFRQLLLTYLARRGKEKDSAGLTSAREYLLASWAIQLSDLGEKSTEVVKRVPDPMLLCRHFLELWNRPETLRGLHDFETSLNTEGYLRLMTAITATQSQLVQTFPRQMGLLMGLMSDDSASNRKQAVKALSQVLEADTKLMLQPKIKHAVAARFQDESKSVREAIVSLVGQFVVAVPEVANAFASSLLPRLSDEGVSVRKKTVRIFHEILISNPTFRSRATVCAFMLRRASDPKEDDSVRDLIHALFAGLWLGGEIVELPLFEESIAPSLNDVPYVIPNRETGVVTPNSKGSTEEQELCKVPAVRPNMESNMQVRCRIASEQMIEVVAAANSKDVLLSLLRDLLFGLTDSDKDRKASEREKRKQNAIAHCSHLVDALFEHLLSLEETRSGDQGVFTQTLVAMLRTIGVFAEVTPTYVLRHIQTLLPYLKADNGVTNSVECDIVSEVCDTVYACSSVMPFMEYRELCEASIAHDFISITYRFGSSALSSSIRALSGLANHPEATVDSVFAKQLKKVATTFYGYLLKNLTLMKDVVPVNVKTRSNVQRALAVMGALCRNHAVNEGEADSWIQELKDNMAVEVIPIEVMPVKLIESCYRVFSAFLAKVDVETKCSALRALAGIFVSRPRVLLAMEQSGAIAELMSDNSMPELQLQALRSWREILLAEEDRIASGEAKAKMESNTNVTLSKKIQGDQDSDATLVGGVLAQHANRLFQLTAYRNPLIRFAAVDLLGHLLRQGLINPMQAVPFLFGLQGDVESPHIRSFALKLLSIESEKRPEMIRQRVNAGIKQAYRFQRHVYPNQEVTAVIQTQNGDKLVVDSMFSSVFKDCIRSSTKNKTGLFRNLLSLFEVDESNDAKKKEKGACPIEMIPLLSFASQVLAHLPYNTLNDPLFIIYHVQGQVALQGQQLVDKLTTFLQRQGVPSVTVHDELNTQEDALEIAATRKDPTRSKEASAVSKADFELVHFAEMCAQASAFVLLLRLKSFLRTAYNISEARCLEYSPDAKERNWDKISTSPNFPSVFNATIKSFFRSESQNKKKSVKPMNSREINKDALIKQYAEFRALMRVEQAADIKLDSDDDNDDSKKRKLKDSMEDGDQSGTMEE